MIEKKIAVIGAGGWGTALAVLLGKQGYNVCLWCFEKSLVEIMKKSRINSLYLPGVKLPTKIEFTNSLEEAVKDAGVIFSVVPSQYVRDVTSQYSSYVSDNAIIISATKGLEGKTFLRMSQVISKITSSTRVLALSGPTFAIGVAKGQPTLSDIAGKNIKIVRYVQKLFSLTNFKLRCSRDIIGVEFGGALKNIIAIAAGISDGLGFGKNARAALITLGLGDMIQLGMSYGAKITTFYGLSGMGDLNLTANSIKSRNYKFGKKIGQGEKLSDILNETVEGVKTTEIVSLMAKQNHIKIPIMEELFKILFENKDPREAVEELMSWKLKWE
jgi:glycerol-3-phosphate dehydrogenase (NAD(P)+)